MDHGLVVRYSVKANCRVHGGYIDTVTLLSKSWHADKIMQMTAVHMSLVLELLFYHY